MDPIFIYTLTILGGLGFFLGIFLAFASKKFAVEVDPRAEEIVDILPGANCGGCGYAGCAAYADALVNKGVSGTLCAPGGNSVTKKIAEILGLDVEEEIRRVAYLHCAGSKEKAKDKYIYNGVEDCSIAASLAGGHKACAYGCLGFGNCVRACKFDALFMGEDGLPWVDREKCTGCGACVRACPKKLFSLLPDSTDIYLACSSHEKGKAVKDVCSVGCISCGICAKISDNIEMKDNLPEVDYDSSPNLTLSHYKCPTKSYIDVAPGRPHMVIDIKKCKGNGECAKVCPVKGCITGEPGEIHRIDPLKCIGCGLCLTACPEKAVRVMGAMGYQKLDMSS